MVCPIQIDINIVEDKHVPKLLIKVFLGNNCLSFYLAITSIMLVIMPSLPISKKSFVSKPCDDVKRN